MFDRDQAQAAKLADDATGAPILTAGVKFPLRPGPLVHHSAVI